MKLTGASLVTALGTAAVAVGAFGAIHAAWIVPIWPRLLGGLPFALAGALVLAWCYSKFLVAERVPRPAALGGLVFGLGAWVALIPSTGAATLLRLAGFHQQHAAWSTAVELGIAALMGYFIGRWARLQTSGIVATTAAALVLLSVQAGPIPVVNGWRPLGLFLLMAPLYALCGLVQALGTAWLADRFRPRASPAVV